MAWKGTELIIRIAADLKKYRGDLRDVARETRQQMGDAARATDGLTNAHKALEGQAGRAAQQLVQAGRAAASGDFARAGQDVAQMASHMSRGGVAATALSVGLGVAAAALAGWLLISFKASEEYERQANLMRLTGNAAGLLAGDVNRMARSVADSANTTVGNARQILEALQGTGQFGKVAMGSVSEAIALVARASGEGADRVTADFSKMADGVTKWAVEHNERYHFLTVEQYRYIKALEDAGQKQQAMIAVGEALKTHLSGIEQNVGTLQRAWRGLAAMASSAWDAMLNIGRADTTADKLDSVGRRVEYMRGQLALSQKRGFAGPVERDQRLLDTLLQEQSLLQETARLERRSADAKAESARQAQAQIAKEDEAANAKKRGSGASKALTQAERELAEQRRRDFEVVKLRNQAVQQAWEEEQKALQASIDLQADVVEAQQQAAQSAQQQLQAQLEANEALGLEGVALAQLQAQRLNDAAAALERRAVIAEDIDFSGTMSEAYRQEAQALRELATARVEGAERQGQLKAIKDEQEAQKRLWQSAQRQASAFFVDLLTNGSDAFKRLGQTLQRELIDRLVEAATREWIIKITGQASGLGGGSGGMNWLDLAQQAYGYYTGGAAAGSTYALASGSGSGMGLSAGAAGTGFRATGGTGLSYTASTQTAGSGAAAGGSSMAAYAGYAALIYAAVQYADRLYGQGYNRNMLGDGQAERYRWGYGNTTSGYTDNAGYDYTPYKYRRQMMEAMGMSEKWADIFSSTTRWAHMFGRKLKSYGYDIGIDGGNVSVSGYERYKSGWAGKLMGRGDKTMGVAIDERNAAMVRQEVEAVREGAKGMAAAMGMSSEAIDAYTGKLRVNFKGANTAAEQAERMAKAMDDLQYSMINAASGGKMARAEFDRLMESVRADIDAAGISTQGITGVFVNGIMNGLSGQEIGAQLSQMILGGIVQTFAQQAFAPVAQAMMTQIITPIFTAIAAGVPISQAVSKASIASMVASAQQAMEVLNEIFNSAEMQEFFRSMNQAFTGMGNAAAAVHVPNFRMPSVKPVDTTAQDTAREREQLERELLRLQGNTVELRRRELEAIKPANRALQEQIWALQDIADMKDAWRSLSDSIIEEIARIKGEVLGETNSRAYLEAQFAIATAATRAGDQDAAGRLADLSSQLRENYERTADSQADLAYLNASLLASMEATNRVVSGFASTGVVPSSSGASGTKSMLQAEMQAASTERVNLADEVAGLSQAVAEQGKSMKSLYLLMREVTNEGAGMRVIEGV